MLHIVLFIAAFAAFSISLICGGGAGLLLIPILGYALPAAQVPAALSLGTSVSSVTKLSLFYQHIHWQIVKSFLPMAIPGVILGAWMLSYLNPMYIELCMAIFLVSNLPYLFKKVDTSVGKNHLPKWILPIAGLSAGFISGLVGAVGVLFNRLYFRYGLNKEQVVATRAANEVILHIIKLVLYAYFGLLTLFVFQLGVIVAVAAVLATYLMKMTLPKIPINIFTKIGYGAMVIAGLLMLNSAVIKIQTQHEPRFEVTSQAKGFDAALSWGELLYIIEFKYGKGFEFEKTVPFSALSPANQAFVMRQQIDAKRVLIEKEFSFKGISYEIYYFDEKNRLIKKIKIQ